MKAAPAPEYVHDDEPPDDWIGRDFMAEPLPDITDVFRECDPTVAPPF